MPILKETEIDQIEKSLGHPLPALYRQLLMEIGPTEPHSEIEIYHPHKIEGLYAPFFEDETQLFNMYFPFGCDNHLQELWIIDPVAERAASIGHETVPEDWAEEDWRTYDQWLTRNSDKLEQARK